MTTIPQLPTAASVGPTDLLALSQNSMLYAASVQQVTAGLQHEISLPTGDLLGRNSAGAGAPEAVTPGAGLALGAGTLAATGTDHLGFALLGAFSATDEVVVNAQGAPGRLPVTALRGLFAAGTGLAIDANGTLSVTASAIAGATGPAGPAGAAGPAGPAGPAGSGLNAPGATNSASTIGSADFVAIWQNGANAWLSYEKLVGGQTIDQLPAAGPAADSDLLLVAQGGNALASQSFAAIWTYAAQKIPTMRRQVVELNSNTVLDATTHNQRVLVASQPITLTANFTNMGSGFTCRVINLAAGPVTMGTGITSGTGVATLPPGTAAELTALTYSGGSLVWWDGIALPTPTITVNAPGSPAANAPFTVSGGLFDEAPTALDYSTDGTNWTAVASPMIGAGSYSFQVPGLPAGSYTIAVRDHNATGVVGRSAPFSVATAAVALAAVPASASAGGFGVRLHDHGDLSMNLISVRPAAPLREGTGRLFARAQGAGSVPAGSAFAGPTPAAIAGLAGWWDAGALGAVLDANGNPLTAWNAPAVALADKSGNGVPLLPFHIVADTAPAAMLAVSRVNGFLGAVGSPDPAIAQYGPTLDPDWGLSLARFDLGSLSAWTLYLVWTRPNWRQGTIEVDNAPIP
jgi:hypothetical protein